MSSEVSFACGDRVAALQLKPSARARTMRLRVDALTGNVVLTLPRRASRRQALLWAAGQREWVEQMLGRLPARTPLAPGAILPIEDQPHLIEWQPDQPRTPRMESGRLIVGGPREGLEARLQRWLRAEAGRILTNETHGFADKAKVAVTRVAVGDPRSRWGSCSSSGAIRYSWRLLLAPAWVRRATVAHEVAHRVHMNHGRAFHRLVAELLGDDPAPARAWLRAHGAGLYRFGSL